MKEPFCRRFHAIDAITEFRYVQIDFQNPPLRPQNLDQHGKVSLKSLPDKAPAFPKEQILSNLLADGAGASQASTFPSFFQGFSHGLEIKSKVFRKFLIFSGNSRQGHVRRYISPVNPMVSDGCPVV